MILNLSEEVNYDMFNILIKAYNSRKEDERIYIYFSSTGGFVDVAEAIIDFINKDPDVFDIIFYGEVFSSGMYILLKTTCHKSILNDTRGMFHYSFQEMNISEGGKPSSDYDIFTLKEMKASKLGKINYLKTTPLSEREIACIKRGKDVYFSYQRLSEIINAI